MNEERLNDFARIDAEGIFNTPIAIVNEPLIVVHPKP
jgi:hypothetical protein